ncbi:DMT family transporter [Bacillus salipaludis]|uniref:DMT family transporter n=1 Tax=Bacillus salipaludis TaxID=2547811 RepID=UPI002E1C6DA0|nr:DMT family transporter [Bacillus salipaludis]
MQSPFRIKTALAISFVVIIWGMNWPVSKYALPYTPPLLYAGMRTLLGGILLALVLLPQWEKLQWRKNWIIYFIVALLNTVIFNGVQTIGLQYLPSGLFSVIVYLQPVLVTLFSWMWLKEPLSSMKVVGLILGFLGVAVISLGGIRGDISILGISLALITGIGWSLSVVFVKKTNNQVHGLWLVAIQGIIGGSILTGTGLGIENPSMIVWNIPYLSCLLFSAIFAMAAATAVYFKLMNTGESSKIASFTFLVPVISVAIGTLFLHEPFTYSLLKGLALILLSIYLINRPVKNQTIENQHVAQ